MTEFNIYYILEIVAPILFLSVVWATALVLPCFIIGCSIKELRDTLHLPRFSVVIIKTIFPDFEQGPNGSKILGRKATVLGVVIMHGIAIIILGFALVSMWYTFIIKEFDACNPEYDCFTIEYEPCDVNSTTTDCIPSDHYHFSRILNCSQYEKTADTYPIGCYKFSFDYTNAIGIAGGLITFSSTILNLYGALVAHASNLKNKYVRYVAVISLYAAAMVAFIIIVATFTAESKINEVILKNNHTMANFGMYAISLFIICAFTAPTILCCTERESDPLTTEQEKENKSTQSTTSPKEPPIEEARV